MLAILHLELFGIQLPTTSSPRSLFLFSREQGERRGEVVQFSAQTLSNHTKKDTNLGFAGSAI